jgi:hypothetical protein
MIADLHVIAGVKFLRVKAPEVVSKLCIKFKGKGKAQADKNSFKRCEPFQVARKATIKLQIEV